ncbi:MAG: hypothetical protein JXR03_05480 [Cyclobacteriaceae bacterium]
MKKGLLLYSILLFLCNSSLLAQKKTVKIQKGQILILEDSIIAPKKDTLFICEPDTKYKIRNNPYASSDLFYKGLKEKSSNNKVTDRLSDLFLVSPNKQTLASAKAGISSEVAFKKYEGKIIRNIRFKHVDMLEGSVQDTLRFSSSELSIFANKSHYSTKEWVLKSNMNIREGQKADPFILADNERLLRQLLYVEDAKIYIKQHGQYIDLIVAVKDRLAWGFQGSYSNSNQFGFEVFNRSVAGLGRFGSIGYYHNSKSSPVHGYSLRVGGQNTLKLITSWEVSRSDFWDKKDLGLDVQKQFVTPEVKYGGGLELRTITDSTIVLDGDTEDDRFYKLNFRDIWAGRSFLLHTDDKRRNIVLSGRFLRHKFDFRPSVAKDSNEIYYNRKFILTQASYAKQKFIKSNYVLGFGISEDIPVGYRFSILYGRDFNEFFTQNYAGFQYFLSKYIKGKGYFLINVQLGGFAKKVLKTGVYGASTTYYTPLINIGAFGRYKNRTFISAGYTNGYRQPQARNLTLEGRIRDINGVRTVGDIAKFLKLESVLFTPWYFYGFRFAPFVYGSVSTVIDNRTTAMNHSFDSFGLGFRLKNESLVFNTFEVRATRFVVAPNDTDDFLISVSVTTPITFRNIFNYKPRLIPFQ